MSRLGVTLAHEHVVAVTDWIQRDYPDISWSADRDAAIEGIAATLRSAKARGIETIIDCTAIGHSRDVSAVAAASALANVNVIVATGVYTYDPLPLFFKFRPPRRRPNGTLDDILVELFIRDITVGIQGTGIKAGVIKCATDAEGVTPNIDRILRAVARAHRMTGVPITTHSHVASQSGLEQIRVFREEGVDMSRVVIGHSGDSTDLTYLRRLLDTGAFIGADRFGLELPGMPSLEQRIETVAALVGLGYAGQILMSHDYSVYTDWWPANHGRNQAWRARWNLELIPTVVLSALRSVGIGDEAIEKLMVGNPAHFLENRGPY